MAFHRSTWCLFAVLTASAVFSNTAAAVDMFCQNRIVSEGSTMYDVQALCGAPDAINRRIESRRVRRLVDVPCSTPRGATGCVAYVDQAVEVEIQEWTYDFGPYRFLTYLSFADGTVQDIRTGNYGHKTQ